MEDKVDEMPFTSVQEMQDAMHDLAGIRISLYFPSDLEKVVAFLRTKFVIDSPPSRKGGLAREFQKVRGLQENIGGSNDPSQLNLSELQTGSEPSSSFAGYRATHVVVRNRPNSFPMQHDDDDVKIEIQIGTAIMHAWSEIEHDILYKPLAGTQPSADELRMLDMINGIVMTGEVALHQLSSVSERINRKAANFYDIGAWLHELVTVDGISIDWQSWSGLSELFLILRATDAHTYCRVRELCRDIKLEQNLPHSMIRRLCEGSQGVFPERSFHHPFHPTLLIMQYWAACLVETITMALFFGKGSKIEYALQRAVHDLLQRDEWDQIPLTFSALLDILHPALPSYPPSTEHQVLIIKWCKALLDHIRIQRDGVLSVYQLVAAAGYTARPVAVRELSEQPESVVIAPLVPLIARWATEYGGESTYEALMEELQVTTSQPSPTRKRKRDHGLLVEFLAPMAATTSRSADSPSFEPGIWQPMKPGGVTTDNEGSGWTVSKRRYEPDESIAFRANPDTFDGRTRFTVCKALCRSLGITTNPNSIVMKADRYSVLKEEQEKSKHRQTAG
jgi:ppGpp synthetase/RelA/SpoT-type nucleotidyltranferase